MVKVAIYCRVSTQEQTVENQKLALEQYANRMGWQFQTFVETESSRKTRPIQWDLYNRLLKKEFDGLLIYKFDRWARSTKELIEHIENLVSKNVAVYSFMENIDLSTSMGKAMLTIISAFAQLERDIIRERTMAGLARARSQGKILGRPRVHRLNHKKGFIPIKRMICKLCKTTSEVNTEDTCHRCYVIGGGISPLIDKSKQTSV
jgi:DNA invertase Pin-like site-specific DNA recombinase